MEQKSSFVAKVAVRPCLSLSIDRCGVTVPLASWRYLADDAAATHRLQRARQTEDAPVSLAELDALITEPLEADTVTPL